MIIISIKNYQYENLIVGPENLFMLREGISLLCREPPSPLLVWPAGTSDGQNKSFAKKAVNSTAKPYTGARLLSAIFDVEQSVFFLTSTIAADFLPNSTSYQNCPPDGVRVAERLKGFFCALASTASSSLF
jgi:hypothetical protein